MAKFDDDETRELSKFIKASEDEPSFEIRTVPQKPDKVEQENSESVTFEVSSVKKAPDSPPAPLKEKVPSDTDEVFFRILSRINQPIALEPVIS